MGTPVGGVWIRQPVPVAPAGAAAQVTSGDSMRASSTTVPTSSARSRTPEWCRQRRRVRSGLGGGYAVRAGTGNAAGDRRRPHVLGTDRTVRVKSVANSRSQPGERRPRRRFTSSIGLSMASPSSGDLDHVPYSGNMKHLRARSSSCRWRSPAWPGRSRHRSWDL